MVGENMDREAFDSGFIIGYAFDGYIQVLPPSSEPHTINSNIIVPGGISDSLKDYWNGFFLGAVAKGVVEVPITREGWFVETIRTKAGLGDLSFAIKRKIINSRPTMIYNIYIDNGVIRTATREYPGYSSNKWRNQFDLGVGTAVAIAFNGYWDYYNDKWHMITDEWPHLFWVNDGNLYMQIWDDEATKLQLATDVIKVKAIRAWRNINISEVDQGLVVGYIKSDGVYYRNYAYQEDGSVLWEPERQVYAGTVNNLNLFLTNDYRMGFAIEDSSNKIRLYITDRVWTGMGTGREKFIIQPNVDIGFLGISYHNRYATERFNVIPITSLALLYGSSFNEILSIENIDDETGDFGNQVHVIFRHSMFNSSISEFVLQDENEDLYLAESITEISSTEFIIRFMDFNNSHGDLTFKFTCDTTTNEAGYPFDNMTTTFTSRNLVPTVVPEVEAIWNE